MVRTGARAETLRRLLVQVGLRPLVDAPPRPTAAAYRNELHALYQALGGLQDAPVLRPGAWDLVFEGPVVVELDEELRFNRHRARSMEASWEQTVSWADDYHGSCRDREPECLAAGRWGARWTNASCARLSGGVAGDLTGDGAPRWKQRALFDAVKDTAATDARGVALARLAVYDLLGDKMLGDVLRLGAPFALADLRSLLDRRTA